MKDITRRDSHPSTNSINSSTSQAPTTCTPHVSSSSDSTLNPNRFTRFRSSDNFLSFTVGLALFVDLLCYGIIMPITPFIIARLGLQSTANGALIAAYAAGTLIASPIVGILSDKMANRRTPMLVGLVALLLSMVMFMEALDHYWILLVSRLAAGVAGGTMMTLGFALLSDTYPANQLGMQMGKVMIGHTMGMMAGPPLGGILQEHVGTKAPYVFCLILITIDLAARLLIIEPRTAKVKAMREYQKRQELEHQQNHEPNYNTDAPAATVSTTTLASGNESPSILLSATIKELSVMRELLTSRRLLTALFISFLEAFLVSALEPVLPLYLEHRFAFSETQIGLSFLAFSVPTIISPVAGYISDRYGTKIMSGIAVSFCSVFVVLLGIPGMPLWGIMLLLVATGSCCAVFITPVLGEISAVVRVTGEGDGFARAFALFNMCFSVGMLAGPLLGSLIYQETSMLWTSVLNGAITIVGVPLVLLYAGDKAQKLRDQAQYEKDKMEEDMMVGQIQQQEITEMKPSLYTPRSHPPAGDAS
ncbi:major facilitator superfamily domain-containing protein [Mortierella sp. GBAus27b]|nr:major facilitator superfamily domain-containing protein [Mortierella sp. GBAus27b]